MASVTRAGVSRKPEVCDGESGSGIDGGDLGASDWL